MNALPFGGVGIMFFIIPVLVILGFMFIFSMLIVRAVKGARQWNRNNNSPVLTVDAIVVTKRSDVSYYHHNTGTDNMHHTSSSTSYYVTFEVSSGDRMEFEVHDKEYGLLVEQDAGKLTFQGTRYLDFERKRD